MARDHRDRGRDERQGDQEERVVKIRRCAAVVKGGRRFSFNALVVVGDRRGKVAWGYGKANEVPPAVEKASKDAQETLKRQLKIQLRGETIPHRVIGRFGGSRVVLVPAGPGTGVKAGPGFRHASWDRRFHVVNVGDIDKAFDEGATVDAAALRTIGLAKGAADGIRILGTGEVTKRLVIKAHHFSKSAAEKIAARGGTAE